MKTLIVIAFLISMSYGGLISVPVKGFKSGLKAISKSVHKAVNTKYLLHRVTENTEKFKTNFKIADKKHKKKKDTSKNKPKSLNIKIVSWNLKDLGKQGMITEKSKIEAVKNRLKGLSVQGVDIILLQELRISKTNNELNVNELVKQISNKWYTAYSSELLGKSQHKEAYAILVSRKLHYKVKNIQPLNKKPYKNSQKIMQRPPFGIKLGNDIIVLNSHIVFDKENSDGKLKRVREVKLLKKSALNYIRYYSTDKKQPLSVIIGGDFNLNHKKVSKIMKSTKKYVFNTFITDSTTKGGKNYDHFITITKKGKKYNIKSIKESIHPMNYEKAKYANNTSFDHNPIEVSFQIPQHSSKKKK